MSEYKLGNNNIDLINVLRNAFNFACDSLKDNKKMNVSSFGEILFNKFQEVSKTVEDRGLTSDRCFVKEAVFGYFLSMSTQAEVYISNCLMDESTISSSDIEESRKKYEELCNALETFDLDKDVDVAIELYIDSLIARGVTQEILDLTIKYFNNDLRALNINKEISNREIGDVSVDKEKSAARNVAALEHYREMLNEMCGDIIEQNIGIENYEKNRVSVNPINIYVHNKMGEIYKFFERKNFSFADSSMIDAISCYFIMLIEEAKNEVQKYYEENQPSFRVIMHEVNGKRYGMEHIKRYNELSDKIYNFSMENDCVEALNSVLDSFEAMPGYEEYISTYIDRYNYELSKLGIDQVIEKRVPIEKEVRKKKILDLRNLISPKDDKKEETVKKRILKK